MLNSLGHQRDVTASVRYTSSGTCLSHLPPSTLAIFPETEFRTRGRASLKHMENKKSIKVLWKDPLLQHIHMNRPELPIWLYFGGTGVRPCVCTSPGRAFMYFPLKGLDCSGRGRSSSVCPWGLPNLSHLKGESHYKKAFPLLLQSTFSHFSVSSLFGSHGC